MKVKLYACVWLLLLSHWAWAQTGTISGRVVDGQTEEGLPGVNIRIKNTSQGTITDFEGNFRMAATAEDTLVISFVGYVTEEVPVGNQSSLEVSLLPDLQKLSEVVVVGYGTSTKKELTGAVSVVGGDEIQGLNPTRVEQALQGQVAGVNVTTASGSPGGALNIRIRGLSTNGNNAPLVLVDGIPYSTDGLAALNPDAIESINVLKDATAGIYGVQAANGVVLITTKKGRLNTKPNFSFDAYYGIQETTKKLDLLNAREFAILKNETLAAGGQEPLYENVELGAGTDWQDEVFQKAPIQSYNLNVSGGSEHTTYSVGASYFDQEGIVGGDKSGYTRYNARLNFVTELAPRLELENVFLFTNEERSTLPENTIASVLYNTINASPIDGVYNESGGYTYLETFSDLINPLAQMANTFNETGVNKVVGKQELSYEINDHFTVSARAGYNYAELDIKEFFPLVYYGSGKAQNTTSSPLLVPDSLTLYSISFDSLRIDGEWVTDTAFTYKIPRHNSVSETNQTFFNYNLEAFLNYQQEFNEVHKVKGTLGISYFGDQGESVTGVAFDVPYNSWDFADISSANGTLQDDASSYQFRSRLQSVFGRAEYSYLGRYLVSAILRRDASSRFGRNYRVGYFPAASAAWVISDEEFFTPEFISFLKLRASYGVSGNDRIGDFRYRGLLNGEGVYVFNDNLVTGKALGTLGNEDLRWEQTSQANIGFDMSLLNGRLDFNVDYFIKTTKDLLFQPDVSGVLGAYGAGSFPPYVNAGTIRNNGLEFLVAYRERLGNDFNFNITYNFATINNEVTGLPEGVDFYEFGAFGVGGGYATRMEVGYPIGYFFGYETDGIYQTEAEIAERGVAQPLAEPGDLRFVDQDGDKVINFSDDSDKTFLGSAIPEFTMGLNVGLDYKGIDISANVYSSIGNEILRNYERQQPLANLLAYRLNRWTGPGSTNEEPRLTTEESRNGIISDYFVEDGSYIRVKNIQLGYTLPEELTENVGVERFRVYVSVNNAFTFTKYRGYDPDFSSGIPNESGIDYGFYPQARTIMTGLNINF